MYLMERGDKLERIYLLIKQIAMRKFNYLRIGQSSLVQNKKYKRIVNTWMLAVLFCFWNMNLLQAQTFTWEGSVSTAFFDSLNWIPNSWAPNTPDSPNGTGTVIIGKGNPYNPTFILGGAYNSQRYGYLNTTHEADFTISGALYTWNSDSINGHVNIETYSELNCRNICYLGRNDSAKVTVTGSLSAKYDIYVGYGTNGKAQLNITDGAVYVGRTLYISQGGSSGHIMITGLGGLHCAGNVSTTLQNWVDNSSIYTDGGNLLQVVYDSGSNSTTVSVVREQTGMLKEYDTYVVLDNGIIKATINKENAKITSLLYNGTETIAQSGGHVTNYYDWTDGTNFEGPSHCDFTVTQQSDSLVDVSFKRVYTPEKGDAIGGDMDIHFVIKKDLSGLYTYSVLEHKPSYPAVGLGSWRMVYSLANDGHTYTCENIYVDSLRHWEMPSVDDYANGSATGIAEIIKLNTGVRAGHYDGKYEYVTDLWNIGTWGFASDINKIGTWMVFGSHEYFNCGPTYHDLNAAAGIIHVCLNGLHYNAKSFTVASGEEWRKIYGPFLIYFNDKNTGDESWVDAQNQAKIEENMWPYSWLKDNTDYPLADERGSISGKFIVYDPYKPEVTGANAWIGVTQISNPNNQWQFEGKNYQYWVKTGADGSFKIPDIRPGSYSLFAFTDGEVGEYSKTNLTVTAGFDNAIGNLTWSIPRNKGKMLWEIGVPNRSAIEFAHGHTDFFEGSIYDNFINEFSNPIEYNVADKNWATALPYAHCPLLHSDGIMDPWKWRLNFNIENDIPTSGNATLTIAFASADHAQLRVYVNNESSYLTYFYPDNAGGNALLRQSIHAMYSTKVIQIPMSELHKGNNTITLIMPSTQSMVNHVMYDYISLEAPVYDCNGVLNGNAFVDSCGTCAGGNTGVIPVLDPGLCESTALLTTLNDPSVNIYPNPSHADFTLEVKKETQYTILDLIGIPVESGSCSGTCIIGQDLTPGTYIIQLNQNGKLTQTKLVKY